MAALSRDVKALAQYLSEAAVELSYNDVMASLRDCLNDEFPNEYAYIADVYGDAESGDVVYCCSGQYYQAPYDIGMINGKRTHQIDTENAKNVLPRTVYDEEADDDDQMTGSMEAYRKMSEAERATFHVKQGIEERFPGSANWKHRPFSERFISKKARAETDASDFAGNYDGSPNKKSFPIKQASDVMAAVRSIGRGVAGGHSATSLKNRIKSIANKKGFSGSLPDAWKGDGKDDKEARTDTPAGPVLTESISYVEPFVLKESDATPILAKLIQPGRGSSGYYTPEVLRRDGPSVFKKDTHMYINHATEAEEAARPEGNWHELAAVLAADARYEESGKDGPGLYAPIKVFPEYTEQIKAKAPHTGVSIKAVGHYAEAATGIPGPKVKFSESRNGPDGKPGLIGKLVAAHSVDFVTRAGAGGKVFTESAATQSTEGVDMTDEQIRALVDAKVKESQAPLAAENKRLREHLALARGPAIIGDLLKEVRLHPASKARIIRNLAPAVPFSESGELDQKKLDEMIESAAKDEVQFLQQLGYDSDIAGIGKRMTEAEIQAQFDKDSKAHEKQLDESLEAMADIFVGPKLVKGTVSETDRQARKLSRKAFREGRVA